MEIKKFTFNPFSENTYLIHEDKAGIIIDPGMSNRAEEEEFENFLSEEGITLTRNILTHCHIDHVLGNDFIHRKYGLLPEYNPKDQMLFDNNELVAKMYGIPYNPSPKPEKYISEKDVILYE